MDSTSTLVLRAESDRGCELDHGWLVSNTLGLRDRCLNALQVVVTILHVLCVPAVGLEPLHDVFSEGALGITVFKQSACFLRRLGNR